MPGPTALPAIDVPAPRMVTDTPSSRAAATAAMTSSTSRGQTTTLGTTRYSEASEEYIALARAEPSKSRRPLRASCSSTSAFSAASRPAMAWAAT